MLSPIALLGVAVASGMLQVRVVDTRWLPLAGINVTLERAANCTESATTQDRTDAFSDPTGEVKFRIVFGQSYVISIPSSGGLEGRRQCIEVLESLNSATAYLQLQLRSDPRNAITHSEPSTERGQGKPTPFDIEGTYVDRQGRAYEVELFVQPVRRVRVTSPNLEVTEFGHQRGDTFANDEGSIAFNRVQGKVTGFEIKYGAVAASKFRQR